MNTKPTIDDGRCTSCGRCAEVCPLNFIPVPGGKPRVAETAADTCMLCGHCVAVCPSGAIRHTGLEGLEFPSTERKADLGQFMALLESRRSRREFSGRELSRQDVSTLLAAGAQAANGLNRRNVHYTVLTDRKVLRELAQRIGRQTAEFADRLESPLWRAFFRLLMGAQYREFRPFIPLFKPMAEEFRRGRDVVCYDAPCAILIHTRRGDLCGGEDAVYCGANILLAAEAMGLGACVIGFLTEPLNRDKALARLAGLPPGDTVRTSIVVGHPRFPYARGIRRPH
ncbi:MAG: nitroreductase family protein [Elusimicrobiota bacterium]|jgi:ferredoxin